MAGGSKSKTKGSGFERDLAKILEKTFGGKFIRAANSGAFVGGLNAGRKAGLSKSQIDGQKADLIAPAHMPRFVVEAKAYKDFRFHQLLGPEPMPQLQEWIAQTLTCADPGDFWIICFKIDRRGIFVFCPDQWGDAEIRFPTNHVRYLVAPISGFITDLESFLRVNRDAILKATK